MWKYWQNLAGMRIVIEGGEAKNGELVPCSRGGHMCLESESGSDANNRNFWVLHGFVANGIRWLHDLGIHRTQSHSTSDMNRRQPICANRGSAAICRWLSATSFRSE